MLTFKTIRYKNFLSTGNVANTIELDKHSSTLITGKNGEGKSTVLCALTFVLFGKPFRNVSKGQLINSINKKNCLVEVEFSVNGHEYVVKRGIKPNIFEIHCDGQLVNQDAALKDYQKVLEQQILKLNYKTFTQVVILGSATYVPFMQLPSAQRREVIEDILDIRVFSVMNQLLKEKAVSIKDQIAQVENSIANHKVKIQSQKKLIDTLESNRQSVIASLQQKIDTNNDSIATAQGEIDAINSTIDQLRSKSSTDEITEAVSMANKMKVKLSTNIDRCNHDVSFFEDNTQCPTCSQHIADDHKMRVLEEINTQIYQHQKKLDQVTASLEKLTKKLEAANALADQIRDASIAISVHTNTIKVLTDQNAELRGEMDTATTNIGNLTEEKSKMKQYAEDAIDLVGKKAELLDERQLHEVANLLLKDTGIKTAIIREYLPVMNKLINKYLAAMDFFVKFELDESFQEVIKSRARDIFTYDSFSEGEKRRIDLAILFTWRQIAKMKNSVNTNLLLLDEILDGALDSGGIDYFLSIMNQIGDQTNVFVISHRDVADKFDNVIRVEKKNDFSVISAG